MGRRRKSQKQEALPLPDWRDMHALRRFITYQEDNGLMIIVKRCLLDAPGNAVLYGLLCSNHSTSRTKILSDPDCLEILKEEEKMIPCSSAGCRQFVWYNNEPICDNCAQRGPALRSNNRKRTNMEQHSKRPKRRSRVPDCDSESAEQ